ncbi:MAG: hypothetical protein V7K70_23695 [Nostoc sp.]
MQSKTRPSQDYEAQQFHPVSKLATVLATPAQVLEDPRLRQREWELRSHRLHCKIFRGLA